MELYSVLWLGAKARGRLACTDGLEEARFLQQAGGFRHLKHQKAHASNKKLVGTSATLVVTGALLVVTRSY